MERDLVPYPGRLEAYDPIVGVHMRTGFADWQSKAIGGGRRRAAADGPVGRRGLRRRAAAAAAGGVEAWRRGRRPGRGLAAEGAEGAEGGEGAEGAEGGEGRGLGGAAGEGGIASSAPWSAAAAAAPLPFARHWRLLEDMLHDCTEPSRPQGM